MRGGRRRSTINGFSSQKEKMAWVRSFIGKKRRSGSGYKRRRSDVSSIRALKPSTKIKGYAGSGKRRRRHRRYGGSKSSVYRSYGIKYPKKHKHRRSGGSMVSSASLALVTLETPVVGLDHI